MGLSIDPVQGPEDIDRVRALFREYAASLDIDLSFQGFETELATLPDKYGPPGGALFLARGTAGRTLGCVGVRPFDRQGTCEMKRLYVRPAERGNGAGVGLAREAVSFARTAGYREMLLDTLPGMTRAIDLYRALGFQEIPPYSDNTLPGMLFFNMPL